MNRFRGISIHHQRTANVTQTKVTGEHTESKGACQRRELHIKRYKLKRVASNASTAHKGNRTQSQVAKTVMKDHHNLGRHNDANININFKTPSPAIMMDSWGRKWAIYVPLNI